MIVLPGLEPEEMARLMPQRTVLVTRAGSHVHGTYIPPTDPTGIDDIDLVSVYIPGITHYFGVYSPIHGRHKMVKEYDCAAYEIRHYVDLLSHCNPNLISSLWLAPEHYLQVEREGQWLIDNRGLFSSRRAYDAFAGYARSQLMRMTSGKDVISACGCEGDFHLSSCKFNESRGRGSTKRFATGFMGAKRKALVQKHGFDTKNAAHLVRLLKMGIEFLRTGILTPDRTGIDAHDLMAIKRGEWALPQIQTMAASLFEEMELLKDTSPLPREPNRDAIDELLVSILCVAKMTDVALIATQLLKRGLPVREPLRQLNGRDIFTPPE